MAKDTKNEEPVVADEELSSVGPKKKKGKKVLIFLVILLIAGGVGFIFRKPIGNFMGTKLKNVPVVGKMFQSLADSGGGQTKEELEAQLKTLQQENTGLKSQIEEYKTKQTALETKVESLKQYETKYTDFMKQKEEWDSELAKQNSSIYIAQFEKVYPDVAEKIYRELKGEVLISADQKAYAKTIGEMDEAQAAAALEILVPTDPELVKMIFANMSQDRKSLILSNMTSETAAQVIKLISPEIN